MSEHALVVSDKLLELFFYNAPLFRKGDPSIEQSKVPIRSISYDMPVHLP